MSPRTCWKADLSVAMWKEVELYEMGLERTPYVLRGAALREVKLALMGSLNDLAFVRVSLAPEPSEILSVTPFPNVLCYRACLGPPILDCEPPEIQTK